ncbi:MAG: PKD domain-containing protein [Candidatus Magasanikbacteria bacterium]|jgi:PKD repeat protein|nr:PKD domain-containing protein [Candidatus Magasanikbacteria bacterium]MBT4314516.1 PKD domain-containing protein [Candidatus Magasanikbacteria bacterium]MBT4547278.1 PKD domain-containing protein [Candidatus Magasanikbacteria bacterium]MBT6818953.1 PKD domain-containing protein [Candidatus Magasanikbacteria bacterium]
MKKGLISLILVTFVFAPVLALAQAETAFDEIPEEEKMIEPIITAEEFVRVDKKLILDAFQSLVNKDISGTAIYTWQFGDGFYESAEQVVHQYSKVGTYTITLTMRQGEETEEVTKDIFVYDKKALLVTDKSKEEELTLIDEQARENGVGLQTLSLLSKDGGFLAEDKLLQQINELSDYINDSDLLIFYSRSATGLQVFSRFFQGLKAEDKKIIANKFITVLTDTSMDVTGNFAYQAFKIIQPDFILLSRPEAFGPLFSEKDYDALPDILRSRGVEYRMVDEKEEKNPVFVFSHLSTWLLSRGITPSTIYLILMIPFLSFFVIFFRQVVGLSTFGVYTPIMIVASFFILGIALGLITFLFAVVTSYAVKHIINKFDLLYLPKVGLNLSVVSLSFLLVIVLAILLDFNVSFSLAIFPMLVMSNVAEKFMAAQTEEGFRGALFGVIETLVVVVVSYYIIIWHYFNNLIMSWPELILLPMLLTLLLAKFSGLRLSEYLRFRSLFSEHAEEE